MAQPATRTTQKKSDDAITLLTADHDKVKKLFKDFEKLKKASGSDKQKQKLAGQICMELTMHMQIEEEIFYPEVRDAVDDDDMMDEAEVEHGTVKDLIAEIESMDPDDALYDAKVMVLSEYIEHHVKEEEDEMFPRVKKSRVDTADLGAKMLQLKNELLAD